MGFHKMSSFIAKIFKIDISKLCATLEIFFSKTQVSVDLFDGRTITVPLAWYPRLLHATAPQRENWKITGAGYGIHWPDIDEDLNTQGLLQGTPAPRKIAKAALN